MIARLKDTSPWVRIRLIDWADRFVAVLKIVERMFCMAKVICV